MQFQLSPRCAFMLVLAGMAKLWGFGCNSDADRRDAREYRACAILNAKLQECGVLTAGRVACDYGDDRFSICELECIRSASCADIQDGFCRLESEVLGICYTRCTEEMFPCADGTPTVEMLPARCNFENDCPDGSDELGCPLFRCADGADSVEASSRCDGDEDCRDGSDERGCPIEAEFQCADALSTVPESRVCDLVSDCADGSDEDQGCARVSCDTQGGA